MPEPADRDLLRDDLATKICSLSYSRLLEYGLTRAADITGLDTIGLPVYTACRPAGEVITVSAGKGMSKRAAKAGAIMEGIELWAAEKPDPKDRWYYMDSETIRSALPDMPSVPMDMFPLARGAPVYPSTPITWEHMHDVFRDADMIVPSDMIWLKPRVIPPFQYFQSSSNGLAAGVTEQDALLQATYELVERDGWALSEYLREKTGVWPDLISCDCPLSLEVQECLAYLGEAEVYPFIFDLSNDMQVPVFGCTLVDPKSNSPGVFAGYGCSLNSSTAIRRAITEAAQARVAYIGSARDDLFRRRYVLMKNVDGKQILDMYQNLIPKRTVLEFPVPEFSSVSEEWEILSSRIRQHGVSDLYSKILYETGDADPEFCIIRVIAPELVLPIWESWTPSERAKRHAEQAIERMKVSV